MRFAIRIVIGAVLGLVALVALWLLGVRWWITAIASGLLAPIGFLGSFFVWSADRPDIGYEQVLFDRPNTMLSALMIVVFAGASFGAGFVHFGGKAVDPAEAVLAEQHQSLVHLYNQLLQGKLTQDDAPGAIGNLTAARDALAKLPESEKQATLLKAESSLKEALDAYVACGYKTCQTANLVLFDTKDAIKKYEAL